MADFSTIKFEEQLMLLYECSKWLRSVRVGTGGTRFEKILQLMQTVVDHYKAGTVSELLQTQDEATLYYVITGATSFIDVYREFSVLKDHVVPRKKLREALRGPLLPWEEQPGTLDTHGRNTLFELETAAWFKSCGIQLRGFDDVEFIFENNTFNVQCKRVYSSKKVEDNVRTAVGQISRRMSDKSKVKGLICLCVDKITDKEGFILEVNDHKEITPVLDKMAHDFVDQHNCTWQRLVNNNILATVVVVKVLTSIRQDPYPLLTTSRMRILDIIPDNAFYQQYDYHLIKRLSSQLGASQMVTS